MLRTSPGRSWPAVSLCALVLSACATAERSTGPGLPTRETSLAALPEVRFSEIHYDNTGTDADERIEISGPAGTSLDGWRVVLYNGSGGAVYRTDTLRTSVPATCGTRGVVVVAYPPNGIQNGNPDGFALVNASGQVVEFLSYGGTFAAVGGAANGLTPTDIGVREGSGTPVGSSLARTSADTWNTEAPNSFKACNDDGEPPPPPGPLDRLTATPPSTGVAVGATVTLSAAAADAEGKTITAGTVTWSDGDSPNVTVTPAANGRSATVQGDVAGGPAEVVATLTLDGVTRADTVLVTVSPAGTTAITRVTFSSSSARFPVGFQTQLFVNAYRGPTQADLIPFANYTVAWEALDPSLATIDPATGVVTGADAGAPRFRVTVTPKDGGAAFQETGTPVTVEARVEADSASTYGDNLAFGALAATGGPDNFLIRRRQFAASYNASRGQPNWVSYEYDARQTGGEDRCNCFSTDPLTVAAGLPAVTTADYTGSGYSRGHMARSADRTRTNVENASTFYLTNIVPQRQDQNGGPWAQLENRLGDSVRAGRAVYIATGPQFNTPDALRYLNNAGKIAIPDSTWKVALITGRNPDGTPEGLADVQSWDDLAGVTVIAVMMPNITNAEGLNGDWTTYRRTADQVEAVTGFDVLSLLAPHFEAAIEAGDRPPVPAFGPVAGEEAAAITFDATASTDPDAGDALTYAWTFEDGSTAAGPTASRTYADNGSYAVTLTATDRFGWVATRTQQVAVANVVPQVTLINPRGTTVVAATYALRIAYGDVGTRDAPYHVSVDWGDGTTTAGSYPTAYSADEPLVRTKRWASRGTYKVRVTVTDKDGGASQASVQVVVR